jgi:hypothetical protein
MSNKMTLRVYLGKHFPGLEAVLPDGGKITAHHNLDASTADRYATMTSDQFLISYRLPSGEYRRSVVEQGGTVVSTTAA